MEPEVFSVNFQQFKSGQSVLSEGELIVEKPVALYVNGHYWMTFMCTPNLLKELVIGFLFNEGVIDSIDQVADSHICDNKEIVDIWLKKTAEKPQEWIRTSGCTGGFTAFDINFFDPNISEGFTLESNKVRYLVETLFESQDLYKKTGGVHTAILTDGNGLILSAEDVGRHNSLDKIAGLYLLKEVNIRKKILLSTGRISSDMLQKAARIGAAIVISRTSPTSMSVEYARKWGITLIGYARKNRFNVYSNADRILNKESSKATQQA